MNTDLKIFTLNYFVVGLMQKSEDNGKKVHAVGTAVNVGPNRFAKKDVAAELGLAISAMKPLSQKAGLKAVKEIEDVDFLKQVAVMTDKPKIGFEAVDKITDENKHCGIAISACLPGVAARAAKKVGEEILLQKIKKYSKHEIARNIAEERLNALHGVEPESDWPL